MGWGSYATPEERAQLERLGELGISEADESTAFRSSHFDQPNILAHVRFNERTDANGKRTLFIEELQSDWHQGGRERGYGTTRSETQWEAFYEADGRRIPVGYGDTEAEARASAGNWPNVRGIEIRYEPVTREVQNIRGVPDAPFKNNAWANLALKRMIRWAAENGFDQIAWTRGDVQNTRYPDPNRSPDAMPTFYDRILVNIANDLGKKYGVRVGEAAIDITPQPGRLEFTVLDPQGQPYDAFDSLDAARQAARDAGEGYRVQEGSEIVHALPITDSMRDAALDAGQPLFSRADGPRARGQNGDGPVRESRDGRAKRDPVNRPEYRARLDALRASDPAKRWDDAGSVPGDESSSAGEAARGLRARRGAVVREVLAHSGVRLETAGNGAGAPSHRIVIDLPLDLSGDLGAALGAQAGDMRGRTGLEFDFIDGANPKEARRPGVHLRFTRVNDALKGMGVGTWLYRHLIDWADRQGLPVYSDAIVSDDAQGVYARLEELGYRVEGPARRKRDGDGHVTLSGEPMFVVSPRDVQTELSGAPPPRDDYQIDGPGLRERLAQEPDDGVRESRAEEYDKMSPVEQALADNPDMTLATESGEVPARQLIEMSVAAQKHAQAMREGVQAAVRCAMRHGASAVTTRGAAALSEVFAGHGLAAAAALPGAISAGSAVGEDRNARALAQDKVLNTQAGLPIGRSRAERGDYMGRPPTEAETYVTPEGMGLEPPDAPVDPNAQRADEERMVALFRQFLESQRERPN